MTFIELACALKSVKVQEQRSMEEDYLELVVTVDDLVAVEQQLGVCFGVPLKPKGAAPSAEATVLSLSYGGVQSNQTMYYRKSPTGAELAMIWPWGNGLQATVKVIKE
jgi:hypothetical protein